MSSRDPDTGELVFSEGERITRGRQARQLLEHDSFVQEAFREVENRLLYAFKKCSIDDYKGQRNIKHQLAAQNAIQEYLQKIVADGRLTEEDLRLKREELEDVNTG